MRLMSWAATILMMLSAQPASAQTTYTYEYDQFGRLIRVERNTGASSRVRYDFDSVDNRTRVKQGISAPVASDDVEFIENTYGPWWFYPLANDTDDDLPYDTLTITGVSGVGSGFANITGGGTYITTGAIPDGVYYWTYTIQDADGNTDTGEITLYAFTICDWCW